MTPAERARHASLVRWKKEQPFAARLAAAREARKAAKKGGKGKGKGGGAKETPDQKKAKAQAEAAKNRAQVMAAFSGAYDTDILKNMEALVRGDDLPEDGADDMIRSGLAERVGPDGTLVPTPALRQLWNAASDGDRGKAKEIIARAEDSYDQKVQKDQAKAEREAGRTSGKNGTEGRGLDKSGNPADAIGKKGENAPQDATGGSGTGLKDKLKGMMGEAGSGASGAAQEKKKGGGGGGGKGKDDKPTPEQTAADTASQTTGRSAVSDQDVSALRDLSQGRTAKNTDRLRALGYIETDDDGNDVATSEGRRALSALERGDLGAYQAAYEQARSKKRSADRAQVDRNQRGNAQAEQDAERRNAIRRAVTRNPIKAHEGTDMSYADILEALDPLPDQLADYADRLVQDGTKAGARNSAADQALINEIYNKAEDLLLLAEELGAELGVDLGDEDQEEPDDDMDDDAMKALSYDQASEQVRSAWYQAMRSNGPPMLDDDGPARIYPIAIYPDALIIEQGTKKYKVGYTVQNGDYTFADRSAWVQVEPAWVPVQAPPSGLEAVKALNDTGKVGAYAILFGSEDTPDLSPFQDFFTKKTDFWLGEWSKRPMLFHHAMDPATKAAPVIGTWNKAVLDDVGVWMEGQLDMAHKYASAVQQLVTMGKLRVSSDSAPHLVVRDQKPNGTNEIKRWPIMAASLTPTPAEPRLLPVEALKSVFSAAGLDLPLELMQTQDAPQASTKAAQAAKVDPEHERQRLLLELDLMELEG